MTTLPRKGKDPDPRMSKYANDSEVARLTARADIILEQLDEVVKQMANMLREGTS